MNIKIACAGKMKEKYLIDAAADYQKCLSAPTRMSPKRMILVWEFFSSLFPN